VRPAFGSAFDDALPVCGADDLIRRAPPAPSPSATDATRAAAATAAERADARRRAAAGAAAAVVARDRRLHFRRGDTGAFGRALAAAEALVARAEARAAACGSERGGSTRPEARYREMARVSRQGRMVLPSKEHRSMELSRGGLMARRGAARSEVLLLTVF